MLNSAKTLPIIAKKLVAITGNNLALKRLKNETKIKLPIALKSVALIRHCLT
jgi:hypothetical protein